MNRKILLALMLSIMLVGCVEEMGPPNNTTSSPDVTSTQTSTPDNTVIPTTRTPIPTPTSTSTSTPTSTPAPTDSDLRITTTSQPEISDSWPPEDPSTSTSPSPATDLNLERGKKYDVTVMEVIEGDIIKVMFPGSGVETVKLLGVEVPDTEPTGNQPHAYKGLTDLRCLADIGMGAEQFLSSLVGENCSIELDQSAGLREGGMLLCYVYNDGDLNKMLLEEGYAIVSEGDYSKRQEYTQIQNERKREQIGLWKCTCDKELPPLTVGFFKINNDAMNDDMTNLNDEYIILKNYGNSSVELYNWSLRNSRNESYALPDISMEPGSTITLRSGSGVSTASDYYLESNSPIWDNQHDSAYLYNSEDKLADYCRW